MYTCLTQLYGGRDIYSLLHKDQLHVSALFIGHLQVDNLKKNNYQPEDGQWKGPKHAVDLYVINYTNLYHHIVVLDKYTHSNLPVFVFNIPSMQTPGWYTKTVHKSMRFEALRAMLLNIQVFWDDTLCQCERRELFTQRTQS